jgi:membrane-bound ClpP family serine protease
VTAAFIALLILAGFVFILFEFLTPTFGPLAALGLLSLIGAVVLAFMVSVGWGVFILAVVLIGTPVYIVLLLRWMPRSRFGKQMFLAATPPSTAAGLPEADALVALVGKTGVAETLLRPAGAVRVEGRRFVARAEVGTIEKGEQVIVVAADAMDVVVRRASK